nr:hypothetical protein [Mycobacterium sp. PS03-16]
MTAPARGAPAGPSSASALILALLALDGVLSAFAGALLLPLRLGVMPFPISAVIVGAVNAALVWAAMQHTESGRIAALPLWTWLATVAVLLVGGPGGDMVFGGHGVMAFGVLIFVAVGVGPAAWLLFRRSAR